MRRKEYSLKMNVFFYLKAEKADFQYISWFITCHLLNTTYGFSRFNKNNSSTVRDMKNLSTKMNCTGLITP